MIACTSSPGCLFVAPFAVVGSIGVIGQSVNIQRTLEGWGIRPLVFRGGRDKAPVGIIGEVTREGIQKVQAMVDDTHRAFKRHVAEARPVLADRIEEIATGDIWLGYDALDVGLVDRLVTSDEYIGERLGEGARVLKLVQLVRARYPFSRPTTSTSAASSSHSSKNTPTELQSFLPLLSDFRGLLEKVADVLRGFDHSDMSTLTKAVGINDVHMSKSPR